MATALHHLTRLEQQRFTGLKGLPVLVGGEHREIHLQRRIRQ
jgi:hypothetical protein